MHQLHVARIRQSKQFKIQFTIRSSESKKRWETSRRLTILIQTSGIPWRSLRNFTSRLGLIRRFPPEFSGGFNSCSVFFFVIDRNISPCLRSSFLNLIASFLRVCDSRVIILRPRHFRLTLSWLSADLLYLLSSSDSLGVYGCTIKPVYFTRVHPSLWSYCVFKRHTTPFFNGEFIYCVLKRPGWWGSVSIFRTQGQYMC
jgi:hypothetical protein